MELRRLLSTVAIIGMCLFSSTVEATTIFSCTVFSPTTGVCSSTIVGGSAGSKPFAIVGSGTGTASAPSICSGEICLMTIGNQHSVYAINYTTALNIQAFDTTFQFVANGNNIALAMQNNTNGNGTYNFFAGAGCESAFFQAFGGPPPTEMFALNLDSAGPQTYTSGFVGSSVQIYQQTETPCNPNNSSTNYYSTPKILTTAVPLTSPFTSVATVHGGSLSTSYSVSGTTMTLTCSSGTNSNCSTFPNNLTSGQTVLFTVAAGDPLAALNGNTYTVLAGGLSTTTFEITESAVTGSGSTTATTGDMFNVEAVYDGTTFTTHLYDVTAGGTCTPTSSGTCFSQSWNNVNIPSMVNGNTAYVGLATSSNYPAAGGPYPLNIVSWAYTVNSAPATPSLSTYTTSSALSGTPLVPAPTASPAGGSYSGTQTVTLSDSLANSYICYATSATTPSILPYPDNAGNCMNGTKYSTPISVPSTINLYYAAGISYTFGNSTNTGTSGLPSNQIESQYTITGASTSSSAIGPGVTLLNGVSIQ